MEWMTTKRRKKYGRARRREIITAQDLLVSVAADVNTFTPEPKWRK